LAERALRPLVILRKITFGHRSQTGAEPMTKITTIQKTGKGCGRNPLDPFYKMYTRPQNEAIRYMHDGGR
jgi:hypothetical protein